MQKENDWDTSEHLAFDLRWAKYRFTAEERRIIDSIKYHEAISPPRHDYMTLIKGGLVSDVQLNFIERWNYCISEKYEYSNRATKLEIPEN